MESSVTTVPADLPVRLAERPVAQPSAELTVALPAPLVAEPSRTARRFRWQRYCLAVDAAMLVPASVLAHVSDRLGASEASATWSFLFPVVVLALLARGGMYRPRLRADLLDDVATAVRATTIAAMAIIALHVVVVGGSSTGGDAVRAWVLATMALAAGRVVLRSEAARARPERARPTLIVGAGKIGQLVAKRLGEQPVLGLRPIGFLDKEPLTTGEESAAVPVLGASWDFDRVVSEHGVEHVVLTYSTAPNEVLLRLAARCERIGLPVSVVPRLFETVPTRLSVEHLGGLPLLTASPPNPRGWEFGIKYAFDRIAAGVLIVLGLPVLIPAAIATWLSVGGPIFFEQRRVGRDGREFTMLKFRSMKNDDAPPRSRTVELPADTAPGGVEGIDRRTRVGTLLRKTSIDELPQLFNVLRGDMSIVGPRPERPEFVALFEKSIYRYADRHRVKAGITGWAQVHGLRGKTSLADRIEWDNYYIENWSLWLDFKILVRTFAAVLKPGDVE